MSNTSGSTAQLARDQQSSHLEHCQEARTGLVGGCMATVRGWGEAGSDSSRSNSKMEVNPSSFLRAIRSRVVMLKPGMQHWQHPSCALWQGELRDGWVS